jgi:hypothetical protein
MTPITRLGGACLTWIVALCSVVGTAFAQEPQAAPRTPMGPGSKTYAPTMMPPGEREDLRWGMNPAHMMQPPAASVLSPPSNPTDLSGLDTAAITLIAAGSAEVVVSSRSSTELIVQLFRPDQNDWQEFRLPPSANTPIPCATCGGKLKLSFNDGAQDSVINVEAPAMVRIFPDATGKRWQWDVFKLQAAAKSP